MKFAFLVLTLLTLAGCAGKPGPNDDVLSDRALNLEEFFEGRTVAYGQFQDLFGNVARRFEVQIEGTWDGEILRLVDSCQLAVSEQVATPANWNQGDDVIIAPAVSNEAAAEKYPDGWETLKPYLRVVAQPK